MHSNYDCATVCTDWFLKKSKPFDAFSKFKSTEDKGGFINNGLLAPLIVVKKDGRHELFDRNKLINGLLRACNKREVTRRQLEEIVTKVERNIRNTLAQEVSSEKIGEMVLRELRSVDAVAYIRFASVYREFADLESFMAELQYLMGTKEKK